GMTELLSRTGLNTEQEEFSRVISHGANSLLALINDILDLSKMESGKLEFQHTSFSLMEWVEDTVDCFSIAAARKRLRLQIQAASDLPKAIIGDPVRLRQILGKLMSNAVKFTAQGGIDVLVGSAE